MNPVAEQLTGWEEAQARGNSLSDVFRIIDEETRKEAKNPVSQVIRNGLVVGLANHTLLISQDGTERPIADSGAPIRDAGGEIAGMVLVFQDQTEERAAQRALAESEHKFRTLTVHSPVGMFLDDDTGKAIYINDRCAELVGMPPEDALGFDWVRAIHPDDRDRVTERWSRAVKNGESFSEEYRWVHDDGHVVWTRGDIAPVRGPGGDISVFIGTLVDISERKRAEEALRESEQKFRQFFENESAYCYMISADGKILDANKAALEVLGFRKDDLIGRPLTDIYAPESLPVAEKNLEEWKRTGRLRDVEMIIECRGGVKRTVLLNADAVRDEDGVIVHSVSVQRDITERKRVEEEKKELEMHIRQQQKLESIGNLAGGIAHDLNNLLSPILGYGEMILEDTIVHDPRREPAEEIVNAGIKARNLVRQLLAFSRKQTLEYAPVDMNRIVTGLEKLLRRTIREDIQIEIISSSGIQTVAADIGQIEQVILNLAVNAADAMPEGGRLTIETGMADIEDARAAGHEDVQTGPHAMLVVSDTGCGMSDEILEHLFEPFFSTKGEKGTGLGLATVFGIVRQHDGHIRCQSESGKGTTFSVYLPVSEEAAVEETIAQKTLVNPTGSEVILLVEDDDQVRNLTNTILKRQGYTVLVAQNGNEALAALELHEKPVHLLLTDVVMPGMNGKELFIRAAERHPDLKVLFMSGYPAGVIASRGVLDEGTAFIQKPFTVRALSAKINEVLKQA